VLEIETVVESEKGQYDRNKFNVTDSWNMRFDFPNIVW